MVTLAATAEANGTPSTASAPVHHAWLVPMPAMPCTGTVNSRVRTDNTNHVCQNPRCRPTRVINPAYCTAVAPQHREPRGANDRPVERTGRQRTAGHVTRRAGQQETRAPPGAGDAENLHRKSAVCGEQEPEAPRPTEEEDDGAGYGQRQREGREVDATPDDGAAEQMPHENQQTHRHHTGQCRTDDQPPPARGPWHSVRRSSHSRGTHRPGRHERV